MRSTRLPKAKHSEVVPTATYVIRQFPLFCFSPPPRAECRSLSVLCYLPAMRFTALTLVCVFLSVGCAAGGGAAEVDLGAGDLGVADLGTGGDMMSVDLGMPGTDAGDLGTTDLGSSDMSVTDLGGTDLGTSDLGTTDLGTTDLGPVDAGHECTDTFDCDDGNVCTDDICDAEYHCTHPAVTTHITCDDGLACTTTDSCSGGECIGSHYVLCFGSCVCEEPAGVCGGPLCKA